MRIVVHPRIHDRHPDVTDEDVYAAWISCVKSRVRETGETVGAGYDLNGRLLEFVARPATGNADWIIYHAMRCTRKALRELGLDPRNKARRGQ